MDKIVILTGAGISAESGLGTFRGPGGLWEDKRIEDLATPEGFFRDPEKVISFHNMRRATHRAARANPAHDALARLQRDYPGEVALITQNVDLLHEQAGSTGVLHMHGTMDRLLCMSCRHAWPHPLEFDVDWPTPCPACAEGPVRPDIVWFGEMPHHLDAIEHHLTTADLFVAIGTSGHVYPAAGFVRAAASAGARTLEINLEASLVTSDFDAVLNGPATSAVPDWVDGLITQS